MTRRPNSARTHNTRTPRNPGVRPDQRRPIQRPPCEAESDRQVRQDGAPPRLVARPPAISHQTRHQEAPRRPPRDARATPAGPSRPPEADRAPKAGRGRVGGEAPEGPPIAAMTAVPKVRLRFAKRGDLRLVSHHDLVRCLERALRRAGDPGGDDPGVQPAPQGHVRPGAGAGDRGASGGGGDRPGRADGAGRGPRRLAATSPPGLEWLGAEPATSNRAAQAEAVRYRLDLPEPRRAAASAAVAELLSSPRAGPTRAGGPTGPSSSTCARSCSTPRSTPKKEPSASA